jgi:hypothetical protein
LVCGVAVAVGIRVAVAFGVVVAVALPDAVPVFGAQAMRQSITMLVSQKTMRCL